MVPDACPNQWVELDCIVSSPQPTAHSPQPLPYQAALDFLFPRTTQIKFGLDATRALLTALGNPQQLYPTIHVAGTNGKGSVSTLIAEALRAAGLRVGLYTSPHLVSFRERIQVDGVPVSEAAVAAWTSRLEAVIAANDATFFEATTAIAFAHFAAREVDIAVIEVGLGGRLDSTNVITPLVSAVTHIALDHQKYLGDTVEAIAGEKAGIAKPGVPFVIGEADSALAEILVRAGEIAVEGQERQKEREEEKRRGTEKGREKKKRRQSTGRNGSHLVPVVVPADAIWTAPLGLVGAHQRRNAAVAAAVLAQLPAGLRPSHDVIARAFARTRVPGRFDRRGKWLFDVAHNPDSMAALAAALASAQPPRPIHALVSILGDKDWAEMLVILDSAIDAGFLTIAPSADTRKWDLGWLERWLADPARPAAQARWRLVPDFEQALRDVQVGAGTVLVTGSFHTVGDVMRTVGIAVGCS
jgi:dihydrofolate synthase/folylpolyglutamate synthase